MAGRSLPRRARAPPPIAAALQVPGGWRWGCRFRQPVVVTTTTPPSSPSHVRQTRPSALLALVCLAIVHRLRPNWIHIGIAQAAHGEGVSPERLSRLCSRALVSFERLLAEWTRIGRPRREQDRASQSAAELAVTRALLAVATSILLRVPLRAAAIRTLIVGAWLRLRCEHPSLTQQRFCRTLALSPRTLRSWIAAAPKSTNNTEPRSPLPDPPPPARKRPPRRPRFAFSVTVPDTQLAADTTDLSAFGVPLKLIAAQDVGGRDQDLLDAVVVDDHESAELVERVFTEAVASRPGIQAITDQGTPYMAEATRAALERLGADHAPQREGHPQGKATIERAFLTVKSCARPLLELTDRIAQHLPTLGRADLAKALTTLVLTALLRAYQHGARAAERAAAERAGLAPSTLAEVARQSREQAHAEERSARLFLDRLHTSYELPGSKTHFIRHLRRFPLPVLRQAEEALREQLLRQKIHNRSAYFMAIVRRLHDAYSAEQARCRQQRESDERIRREIAADNARRNHQQENPDQWLRDALELFAQIPWPQNPRLRDALTGLPRRQLARSIQRLGDLRGAQPARDIASATFADFVRRHADQLDHAILVEIAAAFDACLPPNPDSTSRCAADFLHAILLSNGSKQHPPPS
jgi:transposase InsO family protein